MLVVVAQPVSSNTAVSINICREAKEQFSSFPTQEPDQRSPYIDRTTTKHRTHAVEQLVEHCATSQKVVGSTHRFNPTVDSASNTISTISPGGKGGWLVGLTILPPSRADCVKILGALNSCCPKGLSRPVIG